VALSTLVRCLNAIRVVRQQGIAAGPWELRENWLNEQIAATWSDRGAFPGAGSVLEAIGMRLGTALTVELRANGAVGPNDSPWPVLDAILRGRAAPPTTAYSADVAAAAKTWNGLTDDRRILAELL